MERGVYFDAWFPRQHCYHPSLPPRRLRMVEDLQEYRATALVWSALGGGSIALPYLEQEAFGANDPRFRFYGFVNDAEFIAACRERGIKVFGIVFEVQGWEFPVELNEAEDTILALNELRGAGTQGWLGLREFSQNRYPKLWKPVEHYFPEGLVNSDGERVTDLLDECCSRDIHGEPCHARWVECPDRTHYCYAMDRNNPVWRAYLKAVIRIQIDAGVDGVQLDEAELPITSLQFGGCFCKDCMKGFRAYLRALPEGERPRELEDVDLDSFHYGAWLRERGYDFKAERESTPLFWDYLRFQRRAITRYFGELADYARAYAASKGRTVLVSGNFFNLFDHYYALEPKVDMVITEMRNTTYRQPAWYRYVAGFAGDKPVVVVENPYGGVVPELVAHLKGGRGYDLFRLSLYEAAALGANMSVPYGAWMGSVVQDAFYAPHDLCVEIQTFLADHERLYSRRSYADTAVVYSIESTFQAVARRDLFADNRSNASSGDIVPFWQACEELSNGLQPYDVLFFPEGALRPDTLEADDLTRYRRLILPACRFLTAQQARVLQAYLDQGGRVLALGEFGTNLDEPKRQALIAHEGMVWVNGDTGFRLADMPGEPQVRADGGHDMAINIQRVEEGAAIHLIRYAYDESRDGVPPLPEVTLELRLPEDFGATEVYSPGDVARASLVVSGEVTRVILRNVPLYSIVLLTRGDQ